MSKTLEELLNDYRFNQTGIGNTYTIGADIGSKPDSAVISIDNTVVISQESGLTEDEQQVMDHLVSAFNSYSKLQVQRNHDIAEFITGTHHLQRLIAIRAMRRKHPNYWLSSDQNSKVKTDNKE